jgi:hypothetical protein
MHLFLFTVFEYRVYHLRCGDGRGSEHHLQWDKYGLYRRIVRFPINRGDPKSLGTPPYYCIESFLSFSPYPVDTTMVSYTT